MRILLTGPGGFLGSALARYWSEYGHELILLARPTSSLKHLDDLMSMHLLRASTFEEIAGLVQEAAPDAIVHTACSYGRNGETPLDVMKANHVLGSVLLQAVLDNTTSEKGPVSFLNAGTVLSPDVGLYALSKTQFSSWGAALASQYPERLRFIDILLQQMYGPGDDQSKFTTRVIKTCMRNEPYLALTAGEQKRDFIHIDDVVRAYDCILNQRAVFAANDSIDVGLGEAVTMRDFAVLTKQIAGASTALDFGAVPYRINEPMLCVANTNRIRCLGWQPKFSLAEGLAFTLDKMST
ncbi:NAD-dependent epimerase/dehydratase family protein (plasmid) [Chromobacterium amazonense]|uniref:NAD-dependent epimerase/dehydratase family protein n=1 Tax=Chromobacterium amazonense TaxID=1382803 RepID=UPI00237D87AF|nr:NAD-dependent epimerase/dehydratase family protein [Chromobacterium amazonense]MDE1713188.1 NAD-dependent epimerase/dehydratase family protein [Chromobacterium amazonense]